MGGFGNEPFGTFPFGNSDWAYAVLWAELPENIRQQDLDAGGYYYKFVTALMPGFNELKRLIYGKRKHTADPITARNDLLRYLAEKFGVILDFEEPEDYQRTRIAIAGRWRLIKGSIESFEVLCAVHGFDVVVKELWWNGTIYSDDGPQIDNEIIGYIP